MPQASHIPFSLDPNSLSPRPTNPHLQAGRLCRWKTKRDVGTWDPRSSMSLRCPPTVRRPSGQPSPRSDARGGHLPRRAGGQGSSGCSERTRGALHSRWPRRRRKQMRRALLPARCRAVFIQGSTRLEDHVTRSPRDFLLNI